MIQKAAEKRRYVRIATYLPVEFSLTDRQCRRTSSFIQGFTNNISKAGICLNVNDFSGEYDQTLLLGTMVALNITMPFLRNTISMVGRITWKEKEASSQFSRLRLGIEFMDIKRREARFIFGYALFKKILPYVTFLVLVGITGFSFTVWLREQELIRKNTQLVSEYKGLLNELTLLSETMGREEAHATQSKKRYDDVVAQLTRREEVLVQLSVEYDQLMKHDVRDVAAEKTLEGKILNLRREVSVLQKERDYLKSAMSQQQKARSVLRTTIAEKEKEKSSINRKVIEGMYSWIRSRQNVRTGLIVSYEGDYALSGISYTYDQALAAILFTSTHQEDRAGQILDFYKTAVENRKQIYNAYYTADGSVNEYIAHAGVNAWVGLAAVQYMQRTKTRSYLGLAEYIAGFLESMMDKDGGLVGGPGLPWYSTEHNLDAYAFFRLLYALTNDSHYYDVSERIKLWLDTYAYTTREIPINRGKGDATIATDTYAWSITAVGPETLKVLRMDPHTIIDFALEHCEVETLFFRTDGSIKVRGFDFSKYAHIARGGVISCEWTAQMILALQMMADFSIDDEQKYLYYLQRIILYSSELQKMIINASSAAGKAYPTLPYASDADVDTGHGWRTPRGNAVGSLAATAYYLFAYEGWNPLQARPVRISLKNIFEQEYERLYQRLNAQ